MGLVFAMTLYTAFPLSRFSCVHSIHLQDFRRGCCKGVIKCSQLLYVHHLPQSAPLLWLLLVPRAHCRLGRHHRQLAAEACKQRWWKLLSQESGSACGIANDPATLSLRFLMLVPCISKANQVAGFSNRPRKKE